MRTSLLGHRSRIDKFKNSFVYQGIVQWNSLQFSDQSIPDIDLFKSCMKRKSVIHRFLAVISPHDNENALKNLKV